MDTQPLTHRQKQVLDFVRQTVEAKGRPPSLREIADRLGISGHRAVHKHLLALEKKGHLRRGEGARGLELAGGAFGRSLPILGKVAAGRPILAEENRLGSFLVDPKLAPWKEAFFLKVKGESMKETGILDGDLVLVKPQADAESGEIVVAMVEGEATVKRLVKKRDKILLKPENPAFEPIPITEKDESFRILGKVKGVFRLSPT